MRQNYRNGRLDEFIAQKYSSFKTELGQKIFSGQTNLQELFDYAEALGSTTEPCSGRQEYLFNVLNSILFS